MFTATEISNILGNGSDSIPRPDASISTFSIDSRQIADGVRVCFVALKGLRNDGHQFLEQVWRAGVRNFVVDEDYPRPLLPESNVFVVSDTVEALQRIAIAHRQRFAVPVIGITGSNGKTWVKEWLYQLLAPDYFIVKSPRSYNSQIGVPLSVLQIRKEHTLGIFEAGISIKGEMPRLAEIIEPDIGILTRMGDAHQAGFSTHEEKLREKLELFKSANAIIYCSEEEWITRTVKDMCGDKELIAWKRGEVGEMGEVGEAGKTGGLGLYVKHIRRSSDASEIEYHWRNTTGAYSIPFTDSASVENSITCCAAMLHLGYTASEIAARMQGLHALSLRLAIHHLPGNSVLINDAYSLDMGSLSVALETLKQHSAGMQRTVIMSDIDLQHAGSYAAIAELFSQKEINNVLAIGDEIVQLGYLLPKEIQFSAFADMATFVQQKPWQRLMPGAFLLKGARSFHFERLAEHMQGRYHSAVLEIDLNTLLNNLQFFTSRLQPGTKIVAMVKAAAYGSGGAEIARFLAFHNVAAFAVAYIDEGIDLRNGGIKSPILVMNPDPARVDQLFVHNLEPEVFDFEMLDAIAAFNHSETLRIHVKVDTGMHRLGFGANDATALREWISRHPHVRVASVFTHLAAAGDPLEREFTLAQIGDFDVFYERFTDGLEYAPDRHVLNTNGVLFFPEFQYEAVRLGIGLYGAGVGDVPGLQPVHTLKARLSQIHEIGAGASVGYDRAFKAPEAMRIGTINIGYADGLRRCAGHEKHSVLIHNKPARILGKVCMDMTMVDLSDHPDAVPGDEVIVFGPQLPVDDLARICNTIPYEILTGISQRVARVLVYS